MISPNARPLLVVVVTPGGGGDSNRNYNAGLWKGISVGSAKMGDWGGTVENAKYGRV